MTLGDWIFENRKTHVAVQDLEIEGLTRTQPDFLRRLFQATLESATVLELYENARRDMARLDDLGIFHNAHLTFVEGTEAGTARVRLSVAERRMQSVSIARENKADGPRFSLHGGLENFTGRADDLSVKLSWFSRAHNYVAGVFRKPLLLSGGIIDAEFEIFRDLQDRIKQQAFVEENIGTVIRLKAQGFGASHVVSYEANYREIPHIPSSKSIKVREHCGSFLKSSIRQIFLKSSIDSVVFPRSGSIIQIHNELAGIGGNVNYIKHEIDGSRFFQIRGRLVLNLQAHAGVMYSLQGSSLPLSDRFYMGGHADLKGFSKKTVGERDTRGYALGGSATGHVSAKLFIPVTDENSLGNLVRAFAYVGAGNNFIPESGSSFRDTASRFANGLRVSTGLGVAVHTPLGCVEASYAIPLRAFRNDNLHPFQIGFSL